MPFYVAADWIVVTERYDRQVLARMQQAVKALDDGQPFQFSTPEDQAATVESTSSTH